MDRIERLAKESKESIVSEFHLGMGGWQTPDDAQS